LPLSRLLIDALGLAPGLKSHLLGVSHCPFLWTGCGPSSALKKIFWICRPIGQFHSGLDHPDKNGETVKFI